MKPLLPLLLLLVLPPISELNAQIPAHDTSSGGISIYGNMTFVLTPLNAGMGLLAGAGSGVLFDRSFAVGASGYGLVNRVKGEPGPGLASPISFGYGGLDLRYTPNWDHPMHISVGAHFGGGSVSYRDDEPWEVAEFPSSPGIPGASDRDFFVVLEPAAEIETNIGNDFRVGIGASYRLISGVTLPGLTNDALSGYAIRIGFRLGAFR